MELTKYAIEEGAMWIFGRVFVDVVLSLQTLNVIERDRDAIVKRFAELVVENWLTGAKGTKMEKKVADIRGVVKRQKRYATLAKKEGKYAKKKAKEETKKHMPEMAKDSKHEAEVAFDFASKRKKIAQAESKKLPKKSS